MRIKESGAYSMIVRFLVYACLVEQSCFADALKPITGSGTRGN